MVHRRLVYIYLLIVPSFSSHYFNKIKRTSRLGRLLALSLEILCFIRIIIIKVPSDCFDSFIKLYTVIVLQCHTLFFLFSKEMLVIRTGIHKILVRIANREDPYQAASSEAVWSGSALFIWAPFRRLIVFEILEHLLPKLRWPSSFQCHIGVGFWYYAWIEDFWGWVSPQILNKVWYISPYPAKILMHFRLLFKMETNTLNPDQTAAKVSSPIWVHIVCNSTIFRILHWILRFFFGKIIVTRPLSLNMLSKVHIIQLLCMNGAPTLLKMMCSLLLTK